MKTSYLCSVPVGKPPALGVTASPSGQAFGCNYSGEAERVCVRFSTFWEYCVFPDSGLFLPELSRQDESWAIQPRVPP